MDCPASARRSEWPGLAAATIVVAALLGCVDLTRPSVLPGEEDSGRPIDLGGLDADNLDGGFPEDTGPDDVPSTNETGADRGVEGPPALRSGLVGYWPLDETSGNYLEDRTANENHGQALNGPSRVTTGLAPGLAGNKAALRFDGMNDYAIVGVAGIPANDAARTVALWVNISSVAPSQHFIMLTNGGSSSLELGLRAGVLAQMGGNQTVVISVPAPTRGAWHHIAHTYEGGQNKLYVDGVLAGMATATKSAAPTLEAWLGSARGRANYFGGLLDDVRIYDRALAASDIAAMAAGGAAVIDPPGARPNPPIPDLMGHWKLDEPTINSMLADSSGQNNAGVPVNSPMPADPVRSVVFANPHSLSFYNNQCARLNNPAGLNFSGAITISAWIYPTINNDVRQVVSHGPAADTEVGLRMDNGNYAIYSWNGMTHLAGFAIPTDDIANWIHLAGTYDGTTWRLYRNGRQVANTVDATGAVPVAGNWALAGSGDCAARFFQGSIDDVRIYKRGLTAEEIRRIARGQI